MALVMFCASRLVVISSISPVPNLVGSAGLQCAVYELAYEFGQKVQPGMSSQQRVALSDALARPGCSNATAAARRPRVAAGGGSREASARTPGTASNLAGRVDLPRPIRSAAAGAAEIFVATDGNDGAAGTQGAPLATLGAAQALARKSTGAGAIESPDQCGDACVLCLEQKVAHLKWHGQIRWISQFVQHQMSWHFR